MIHKTQDKSEKVFQSRAENTAPCLTDDELARLIWQVESTGMLRAPRHLKKEILEKLHRQNRLVRERQIFVYRMKVAVTMAAAVAVLLFVPGGSVKGDGNRQENADYSVMSEESKELRQMAIKRHKEREDSWQKYQNGQQRSRERREWINAIAKEMAGSVKYFDTENGQ